MATHNVTINGLNSLINGLKALGADLPNVVDTSLGNSAEYLKRKVQEKVPYDTGQLFRGIIVRKISSCQWQVAATAEHSIFVEFGTGVKGDPEVPHTTRPKWVYFSKLDSQFRTAYPQPPRPYMRPAFAENSGYIIDTLKKDVLTAYLQERVK